MRWLADRHRIGTLYHLQSELSVAAPLNPPHKSTNLLVVLAADIDETRQPLL